MLGLRQWLRSWSRHASPFLAVLLLAAAVAPGATAAGPPLLGPTWASEVGASSARVHSEVKPNGLSTVYRFDYLPEAAYEANLSGGKEAFSGAAKAPPAEAPAGSGGAFVPVSQLLSGLTAETVYRYRIVAKNSAGTEAGPPLAIKTQAPAGASILLDGRAWELVSPIDKNGGAVAAPEALLGGGVLQAAAGGGAVTYGSAASFGADAGGAPPASQYISRRGGGGWETENLTTPIVSGSYGAEPRGVPYQAFSEDLGLGLLLNGSHCRGGGDGCPIANQPLPGSPAGYQNYYLRESGSAFRALLQAAAFENSGVSSAWLDVAFVGADPALHHVVLSSCAALTADAVEVPDGEGCDASAANLYEWSTGGLVLVNRLEGESQGTPGATLAAPNGAVFDAGGRVYFELGGDLYLRDGANVEQVDEAAAGGGTFQVASSDGSIAYFTKGEQLWRFQEGAGPAALVGNGVLGVLGASAAGSAVYYLMNSGLVLHRGNETRGIAAAADAVDYPPATGAARVSADGDRLAFVSSAPLTGFDNTDQTTGEPDAEVYLYDASTDHLLCVSCDPSGARPLGPSRIVAAPANGAQSGAPRPYKPRAFVADGSRLFFESEDALVLADTNDLPDVYEWEQAGSGTCSTPEGCVALVSAGKGQAATFVDASSDGDDVFFLTARSLVAADPGSVDLYDARVGGGFPEPLVPIPCEGDACQALPSEPEDPAVTTLITGPGNPPLRYSERHRPRKKGHRKKHRHGSHQRHRHGGRK
jgi:hypothetical protein